MKNKTYIALGICAGLLVVNTGFLLQISNRQKVLERQMENMQNQVMDSISVNTSSITQRMKNILEKQSSLLSNSNFSVKKKMVPLCFWQKLHQKLLQTEKQLNFV